MKRKEKDDRTTHSKSVMKGPKLSKNCSGPSSGKRRKNSTSKTQSPTREQIRESIDVVKLVVNRKPAIEVRNSRAAEERIRFGTKHANEAQKLSMERSTGKSVAFTVRQSTSKDKVVLQSEEEEAYARGSLCLANEDAEHEARERRGCA